MLDKASRRMPSPNGRSRLPMVHFVVLLTAVPAAAAPARPGLDVPAIRPVVRIVLKTDGSTVEGRLARFSDGAYTLDVAGRFRVIAEKDIRSITFRSRQAAADESDIDKERAQLEQKLTACDKDSAALVRRLIARSNVGRQEARRKLAAVQPDAPLIEAVMAAVRADEHNGYWNVIADVIARWGRRVLPQLDRYAGDEHFRVRRTVVFAWGRMKLPALPKRMAAMVSDRHVLVRLSAAESLTKLTRSASRELVDAAVALLLKSMQDEEIQRVGWWNGASVMADLAPSHPEAIDALFKAMRSAGSERLRGLAARSLGTAGLRLRVDNKNVARIVKALTRRIAREPVERNRATIIHALGSMGKRAAAAGPELRKASDDPSEQIAKAARDALAKIGP